MKTPLASHTRWFMFVVLAAIIPWAILLILFPRHTSVYWMWVMRDPHSAILVGAVYVGASTYYVLSMLHNDWPQTRMGLEGSFTVYRASLRHPGPLRGHVRRRDRERARPAARGHSRYCDGSRPCWTPRKPQRPSGELIQRRPEALT